MRNDQCDRPEFGYFLLNELQPWRATGVAARVFRGRDLCRQPGRHLIRQPDLNAVPFDALVANVAPGPNLNLNALRRYKGYTSIAYRLSDATSTYNGLQLYAAKRKGDLELTAAYTL